MHFGRRTRRIGRMIVGFLAGAFAASFFLHLSLVLWMEPAERDWSIMFSLKAPITVLLGAMIIAVDSAIVALPVILLMERYGMHGWLTYVAAGVLAAFVSYALLWLMRGGSAATVFAPLLLAWMGGAGAVGGLTYWIVAGRQPMATGGRE
jgi:hypothetical protein